jgi:hypothetical protein
MSTRFAFPAGGGSIAYREKSSSTKMNTTQNYLLAGLNGIDDDLVKVMGVLGLSTSSPYQQESDIDYTSNRIVVDATDFITAISALDAAMAANADVMHISADSNQTGTISVTNGSATITGSGTSFTNADTGKYIRTNGGQYKKVTYVSPTELTAESNFTTDESGVDFSFLEIALRPKVFTNGIILAPWSSGVATAEGQLMYDANVLKYRAASAIRTLLTSNSSIDNLNDVVITSAASNQVLTYDGANWVNSAGGTYIPLATQIANNSTSIDFTQYIDGTYDHYILEGIGIIPDTNAVSAYIRVTEDGGSNWKAGASDYVYAGHVSGVSAGVGGSNSAGAAQIEISHGATVSNTASKGFNFQLHFFNPASTSLHKVFETLPIGYETSSGDYYSQQKSGFYIATTNAINGIRFLFNSGNITSGTFTLTGVRRLT